MAVVQMRSDEDSRRTCEREHIWGRGRSPRARGRGEGAVWDVEVTRRQDRDCRLPSDSCQCGTTWLLDHPKAEEFGKGNSDSY